MRVSEQELCDDDAASLVSVYGRHYLSGSDDGDAYAPSAAGSYEISPRSPTPSEPYDDDGGLSLNDFDDANNIDYEEPFPNIGHEPQHVGERSVGEWLAYMEQNSTTDVNVSEFFEPDSDAVYDYNTQIYGDIIHLQDNLSVPNPEATAPGVDVPSPIFRPSITAVQTTRPVDPPQFTIPGLEMQINQNSTQP